ncbi:MAG: glycerophosphodiester phosphodiesterase family protein [Firmicutes bacterium]|nr:glycerophosphodiester phosphodiesterase family protein [Bacillota bacterium]
MPLLLSGSDTSSPLNGWERGADLLELDAQLTKDGHVVVLHDYTLDRTTNGSGPIGEKTLKEVRTLDAGSWFGPEFAGEKIPTFEEVVEWAKGKIRLNVELKSGP